MKTLTIIILTFLGLYALALLAVTFGQRYLMYMPPRGDQIANAVTEINQVALLPVKTQLQQVTTQKNETLHFLYTPPPSDTAPVFVVMLGNAHSNHTRQFYTEEFGRRGFGVLITGYPGYGGNKGAASEISIYDAARRQMRWLQYEQHIPPSRIVIFGQSIGSGIATEVATEFGFAALILESPFTSATDMAVWRFPFFPARRMIWDAYDNIDKIKNISQPTMIYQGTADHIVLPRMGPELFAASPATVKKSFWVEGAGHNNLADFSVDGKPMLDNVAEFARAQVDAATLQ